MIFYLTIVQLMLSMFLIVVGGILIGFAVRR